VLTGGAGSGRFRSVDQIVNGEFGVGVFGSAALQVYPWANIITEWTGQDLAAGVSIVPFPTFQWSLRQLCAISLAKGMVIRDLWLV